MKRTIKTPLSKRIKFWQRRLYETRQERQDRVARFVVFSFIVLVVSLGLIAIIVITKGGHK